MSKCDEETRGGSRLCLNESRRNSNQKTVKVVTYAFLQVSDGISMFYEDNRRSWYFSSSLFYHGGSCTKGRSTPFNNLQSCDLYVNKLGKGLLL